MQFDVVGAQGGGRFVATGNGNGAVLSLANVTASPTYLGAINFENIGGTPGQIGYLANDTMIFRAGGVQRLSLDGNGDLNFGAQTRQMLNLFGTAYAIGVQPGGLFFRSNGEFRWYQGGSYNDGNGPGDAQYMMVLNAGGSLYVNGTFGSLSDRNVKQDVEPVDGRAVLEKVVALPLSKWSFKTDASIRHMGPMAQDFHEAFGLNGDDDTHITTVDADGVALAAIQGLNQKVEERDAKITELEKRPAKLEQLLNAKIGGQR